MTEEQRSEIKKALIKCAEENEGKNTFTGYVIVSSVCKAGAERIAELEKENAQWKQRNETLKDALEHARKLYGDELEKAYKENAELKKDNEGYEKDNTRLVNQFNQTSAKLTKAKKIIQEFLELNYSEFTKTNAVFLHADKFLKESE